jgi:CRISPR-associated protein Cmr2
MFCQLNEEEGSRKCALDGQRTALFYRPGVEASSKWAKRNFVSDERREVEKLLDPGEALSAVSLVKRHYELQNGHFPSTAEIALMNLIGFDEKKWEAAYKSYFIGDVDYQLFYEENLTKKSLKKQGIGIKTTATLDTIINEFRELAGNNLTKYYALLLFDGDDFGKLWSGARLREEVSLMEFQKKLAEQLHKYAEKARDCLAKPKGQVVYTGGDDFLGFVNLNFLFEVLAELRKTFDEIVSEPLREYLVEGKRITFTAGIAIAHYKTPLGEVLKKARAVEKQAKELRSEKDAYGIAVMKHSGETREGFLPFNGSEKTDTLNALMSVVNELKDPKGVSNMFINAFAREMHLLMDKNGLVNGIKDQTLSTELGRLLSRSAKTTGKEKEKKVNACLEVVEALRIAGVNARGMQNFLSLLDICDFFKRETSKDQL